VGSSTSHNSTGLHGLLTGIALLFLLYYLGTLGTLRSPFYDGGSKGSTKNFVIDTMSQKVVTDRISPQRMLFSPFLVKWVGGGARQSSGKLYSSLDHIPIFVSTTTYCGR
jgi:hypothetical protein